MRSDHLEGVLPWHHTAIPGFVVDPDRKKLSKSKSKDDDDPDQLLDRYGPDAIRYWATSARLGTDTTLDHNRMKMGRRLATKLLNVTRFVLLALQRHDPPATAPQPTEPLHVAWLARLAQVTEQATRELGDFDHAATLRTTEEAWSWWQPGSIHRAPWPHPAELGLPDDVSDRHLDDMIHALAHVRRQKTDAALPMRARVQALIITGPDALTDFLTAARDDLAAATSAEQIETRPDADLRIDVELGLHREAGRHHVTQRPREGGGDGDRQPCSGR